MNKKREIAKIVVGLTPVVGVTVAAVEWLVVGTMEHGWLTQATPDALREVQNCVGLLVLGLCIAVPIMGVIEAVKAARRLNGGA